MGNNPDGSYEVSFLDANRDGVSQISELLENSEGKYSAIHIISHGEEGQVSLGNTVLGADNLGEYTDELAGWADALTEDADLLFYGCDLAGNEAGESFTESISLITEADVAASDDTTGHATENGDWDLEFIVGDVQVQTLEASAWLGQLGPRFYLAGDQTDELTVADPTDSSPATNEEVIGSFANGITTVEAIARDPSTGELYGINGNQLGLINQDTGEYTAIGTTLGNASSASNSLSGNLTVVVAAGFDPTTGDLLAVSQQPGADWLFKVDPATGAFIPNAFGAGEDFVLLDTFAAGGGGAVDDIAVDNTCLLYTSPSPRDATLSRMPSSA